MMKFTKILATMTVFTVAVGVILTLFNLINLATICFEIVMVEGVLFMAVVLPYIIWKE